jgi:energy-coupling factor transporter ATP-binding protein EcfA2
MSPVVSVHGLGKKYGDFEAVSDVSFEVESGEIFGILGPNGAGKTTSVECLQGLRSYDRESVSVLGFDPARQANELSTDRSAPSSRSRRYQIESKSGRRSISADLLALKDPPPRSCWSIGDWLKRGMRGLATSPGASNSGCSWLLPWPQPPNQDRFTRLAELGAICRAGGAGISNDPPGDP